jgi:hypothetical protein
VLWELTSIRTWEDLTRERGWTKPRYTRLLQRAARRALIAGAPQVKPLRRPLIRTWGSWVRIGAGR